MRLAAALLTVLLAASMAGCSSTPPAPDWQMNAKASLERAVQAYLTGNARLEALEFDRARTELQRTGRADLLARAELTRCAARVASLVFDDCPGFAPLAPDAGPAERAYADYLAGRGAGAQVAALLPPAHAAMVRENATAEALAAVADPVSRLVAAGVALRSGRASPAVMALAADTASEQGWSRPLLAWLNVRLMRAESAGQGDEAARLRRQIGLIAGERKSGHRAAPAAGDGAAVDSGAGQAASPKAEVAK